MGECVGEVMGGAGEGVAEVATECDGTGVALLPAHAARTAANPNPIATGRMVTWTAVRLGRRKWGQAKNRMIASVSSE